MPGVRTDCSDVLTTVTAAEVVSDDSRTYVRSVSVPYAVCAARDNLSVNHNSVTVLSVVKVCVDRDSNPSLGVGNA